MGIFGGGFFSFLLVQAVLRQVTQDSRNSSLSGFSPPVGVWGSASSLCRGLSDAKGIPVLYPLEAGSSTRHRGHQK